MSRFLLRFTFLILGSAVYAVGADRAWEFRVADFFSQRPTAIRAKVSQIDGQLKVLPEVSLTDQGGTGGYSMLAASSVPIEATGPFMVEVKWKRPARIDLVALVPARNYDFLSSDVHYGLPLDFSVDLLDENNQVIRHLAGETDTAADPVRRGHPFVYHLSEPVMASGLRVNALRLPPAHIPKKLFAHAWAEFFAFEGEQNVAENADVEALPSETNTETWHWRPEFLVDGQTPLGVPQGPGPKSEEIGWLSDGLAHEDEAVWVQVDLGEEKVFDSVRLFPAWRPQFEQIPGFGIPKRLKVGISNSVKEDSFTTVFSQNEKDMENPGENPSTYHIGPQKARYLRVTATKLWKKFVDYPAFFALSELQVLDHETNIAAGADVLCISGNKRIKAHGTYIYSPDALTNGFGPEGKLLSTREWLLELSRRFKLETERYHLTRELRGIGDNWRSWGLASSWGVGTFGILGLVFLPIRYRVREKRHFKRVCERIASDLHDEVGSNLATIGLLSGRKPNHGTMEDIGTLTRETSIALREIIDITLASQRVRKPFLDRLRDISELMLCEHQCIFEGTESPIFDLEQRKNLVFFFKEAIHNIIRHADAKQVRIAFKKTPPDFQLTIEDDGKGIAISQSDQPVKFHTLRQRAINLRGTLTVDSSPGTGTRLILKFPIKIPK